MDELTIEQKAKAYDEVVNKLKGFIAQGVNPLITRDDVQDFFPELAESEDEKIRKELITIISCAGDDSSHIYMSKRDSERYVAWLEKQGEKNPVDKVEPKFEIEKGKWYVCNTSRYTGFVVGKAYYCPKNGMLKPNENEMARYIAKHYFRLWTVEDAKDGDVLSDGTTIFIFKDLLSDGSVMSYCDYDTDSSDSDSFCHLSVNLMCSKITPATKEQHDLLFQKMKEAGYWWDAEKKELKKVEQKPCMIQWKGDNLKEVIDFTGKDKNFDKWFNSFEEYEKFVREHEGILKLFNEDGSHYEVPVGAWIVKTPDGRNVASKAVFKQKPADKIEPKFHEGDIVKRKDNPHLTYILKRLTDDGDYEFHAIGKDGNEGCTCFAGVKYQDDWELVEQKPALSEEDKEMLDLLIANYKFLCKEFRDKEHDFFVGMGLVEEDLEMVNWLKDLKDRVQPQPKQEWNEEDERLFQIVIDILDRQNHLGNISHTDLIACVRKLKSLRPQSTWKPSKEQMKAIEFMVRSFGESGTLSPYGETMAYATSLLNDLKKL